jgi:hypothetical protein
MGEVEDEEFFFFGWGGGNFINDPLTIIHLEKTLKISKTLNFTPRTFNLMQFTISINFYVNP